jgi:hypothetical protein
MHNTGVNEIASSTTNLLLSFRLFNVSKAFWIILVKVEVATIAAGISYIH